MLSSLEAIASAGLLGTFNKLVRMVSVVLLRCRVRLRLRRWDMQTRTVFYDRGYDTRNRTQGAGLSAIP